MSKINNQSTVTSSYSLPDGVEKTHEATSNVATTENLTTSFLKEKSTSKQYVEPGDEVTISLKLTNNSDLEIGQIVVNDTIGNGVTFKEQSVEIDGVANQTASPLSAIVLANPLTAGQSTTITYVVTINSDAAGDIAISSQIAYNVNSVSFDENSNEITLSTYNEKITISKSASVAVAVSGQTIKFTNEITNSGKATNTKVFFKDTIPAGVTFVPGSVEIDGVKNESLDPNVGFSLTDLNASSTTTVTFDVKVD